MLIIYFRYQIRVNSQAISLVVTRQVAAARATRELSTATTDRAALDIPALVTAAAACLALSAAVTASSLVAVRIMELDQELILRMLVTVIIQVPNLVTELK